ncbi:hypothetical protein [Streptomyces violascens]|uniref:hypothetical protein n=1 Tax=Streptomyces violascens TaxID=67381 RepID=UPI001679616A|nr:hypothetical protein [Streptomyces violascens]
MLTQILAPEEVLELLRLHRETPQASPLPPHPATVLEPILHALRQADLTEDNTPAPWDIPTTETEELTSTWATTRRTTVLGGANQRKHDEPQHGAWISDFGYRLPEDGAVAFYRYTSLPLNLTPVIVVPLKCANTSEGEATGALLAHAWARMSGEESPVVHSDFLDMQTYLQRRFDDRGVHLSPNFRALLDLFPAQEIQRLDMRWTRREHDAIAHADQAVGIRTRPGRHSVRSLRRRCALLDYDDITAELALFFEEHRSAAPPVGGWLRGGPGEGVFVGAVE